MQADCFICLNGESHTQANREVVEKSCHTLLGLLKTKKDKVNADYSKKIKSLQD